MHRKKPVNVLSVLPPPDRLTLSEVEGDLDFRTLDPAPGLLPIYSTLSSEQEEAAYQSEKKSNFIRAASLMHEALLSRSQTVLDLPDAHTSQSDCNSRFCQVLYSWAFHFVRDGQLDRAYDLLKLLTQITSHKGALKFKGKKKYRFKALLLHAWYYSKISKHNAAYDYLASCKTRMTIAQFDPVVLALVEGFVLSNLDRVKEAIKSHSEARDRLDSLPRSFSEVDDRGYNISLAVSLYNLAADYCNLYQPKEAAPYIKSAGIIASQHFPDSFLLKDKINSLHEELLGSSLSYPTLSAPLETLASEHFIDYRSTSPPKERRSNSRPPLMRKHDQPKNADLRNKWSGGQAMRKHRKPSSGRGNKAIVLKEGVRPGSSSIGPVSPVASKSSSVKPHRRRRMNTGYKEVENLLRKKMEAMESNQNEREVPGTQARELRQITSAWKRSRDAISQIIMCLKVKLALRKCVETRLFYANMKVWARTYWWRRNARELIYAVKSVAGKKSREIAMQVAMEKRLQIISAYFRKFAGRCYWKAEIAQISLLFRQCKRYISAENRLKKLLSAYVSISNRENTAVVKEAMRRAKANPRFHTSNSRLEVRDETPDLSVLLISDRFPVPQRMRPFTEEWLERASAAVSTYQRFGERRVLTAVQLWKSVVLSDKIRNSRCVQEKSVRKIQSFWRMLATCRSFSALKAAVVAIQRHFRDFRLRKRTKAAGRIQQECRAFLVRRRIENQRKAAVVVQKWYRGFVVRKWSRKKKWAAKALQKAYRHYYRRPYMLQG